MTYEVVLFDADGTLYDFERTRLDALTRAFEEFDEAFRRLGAIDPRDVLIVGDSLLADMAGGIDTCWFNPSCIPRPADLEITYEISALDELPPIVSR